MLRYRALLLVLFFLAAFRGGSALAGAAEHWTLTTQWVRETPAAQEPLLVVWITPARGWHLYAPDNASSSLSPVFTLDLYPEVAPLFPPGTEIPDPFGSAATVEVYEARTPVFFRLDTLPPEGARLSLSARMVLCSATSCLPVSTAADVPLPEADLTDLPLLGEETRQALLASTHPTRVAEEKIPVPENASAEPQQHDFTPRFFHPSLEVGGLVQALLLALLAGIVLNAMPCVLPVLALKLRSIVSVPQETTGRRTAFRRHTIVFAAGILAMFALLGLLAAFAGFAWGRLFQHSWALILLTAVVFSLGLSMVGVFSLPSLVLRGSGPARTTMTADFLAGMLTTILATPCSGPFLGGVLAWLLFQPPLIILLCFLCIGTGMAAPYLVGALFPGIISALPAPGNWTRRLEQLLGFILFATTIYLLTLLPDHLLTQTLITLLFVGLGCFIVGQWTTPSDTGRRRAVVKLLAFALFACGLAWGLRPPSAEVKLWTDFSEKHFARQIGNTPLLLFFTADWCPNCKFLESTVLDPETIAELKKRHGFEAVKVDLTREDAPGYAVLHALDAQSIPVLGLFPRGENARNPLVLRDFFTSGQLRDALQQAFQ